MDSMGAHDSPSKFLQVATPESIHSSGNVTSPRTENSTSLSSKMKRMLSSPKVTRGKAPPSANKTFGVPLDFLNYRDKTEVPLIVTRICDYLKCHGLKQEGLFRVNGNLKVVERLKNAFDKCGDADLEEIGDVPAAASLLKMFLRELSDPVIPDHIQPVFIQIQDQYCKEKEKTIPLFKELVKRLPPANAYLLKYLCTFMLTIADGSELNKMTPLALAIVFGPNIFRCGEGLNGLRDQAYVNAVLLSLLQEFEEIFLIDNAIFKDSKPRSAPEKPIAYYDSKKPKTDNTQTVPEPPLNLLNTPNNNSRKDERNDKSPRRANSAKSPRNNAPSSSRKSPRHESMKVKRNTTKKPSKNEPERSRTPPLHNHPPSPLSKQLVTNTISSAVKEHLFGPDMPLVSSSESIDTNDRTHESSATDDGDTPLYASVRDRVKKFSMESNPPVLNTPTPSKKLKSASKSSIRKSKSTPSPKAMSNITDNDLNFLETTSRRPLQSLTHRRAPSQKRRPPSIHRRSSPGGSASVDDIRQTPHDHNTIYSLTNVTSSSTRNDKDHFSTPSLDRLNIIEQQQRNDNHGSSNSSSPAENRRQQQQQEPVVDLLPGEVKKRIASLKKVITNFDNEFMENHGRKAKPSEKSRIQKYIVELGRMKKQHKEMLNEHNSDSQAETGMAPIGPDLGTAPNLREILDHDVGPPTKEQTLRNLLKRLEEKRGLAGRPHEILAMSSDQLKDEKLAVQKALLQYENIHGRPSSKEDKSLMRPIYDRYRKIKRLIAAYKDDPPQSDYDRSKTIYETDENDHTGGEERMDTSNDELSHFRHDPHPDESALPGDTFSVTTRYTPEPFSPTPLDSVNSFDESVLHNASLNELMEQLKETKNSKKRLGKSLKDFEDEFFVANDRKVQKEDRLPREAEYREYKLIKAKMRLLEALITKRKTNDTF